MNKITKFLNDFSKISFIDILKVLCISALILLLILFIVILNFQNNQIMEVKNNQIMENETTEPATESEKTTMDNYINPFSIYADYKNNLQIYESYELTEEILLNRNGKLIIEKCIGKVMDAETGDGVTLNHTPQSYYINYKNVKNIHNEDIICTYFVYNPDTNYIDDIIMRFDYVIIPYSEMENFENFELDNMLKGEKND